MARMDDLTNCQGCGKRCRLFANGCCIGCYSSRIAGSGRILCCRDCGRERLIRHGRLCNHCSAKRATRRSQS